jgi:hypothetical protein
VLREHFVRKQGCAHTAAHFLIMRFLRQTASAEAVSLRRGQLDPRHILDPLRSGHYLDGALPAQSVGGWPHLARMASATIFDHSAFAGCGRDLKSGGGANTPMNCLLMAR